MKHYTLNKAGVVHLGEQLKLHHKDGATIWCDIGRMCDLIAQIEHNRRSGAYGYLDVPYIDSTTGQPHTIHFEDEFHFVQEGV